MGIHTGYFSIIGVFLSKLLGGLFYGILIGIVCNFWIRKINNDEILVVNLTIIFCYLAYFMPTLFNFGYDFSGIISVITMGIYMSATGKTKIKSDADFALKTFWKHSVTIAETIIFLLCGILMGMQI